MAEHPETKLQIATANYLRGIVRMGKNAINVQSPFPGLIFLHVANEASDKKSAFWNQIKGILPGCPDWLFFWPNSFGAIELKIDTGLSGNQKNFRDKFTAIGGKYAVCKTVAQLRDALIDFGLECKNPVCIEPQPTMEEKIRMNYEYQKPR